MRLFKTIKFRLTVWYLVVILVLLSIFATVTYVMLSHGMYENLDNSLKARVTELHSSLTATGDSATLFAGNLTEIVLFYDANHKLVQRIGRELDIVDIDRLVGDALLGQSSFMTAKTRTGQDIRLYAAPFAVSPETNYAIVVGRNLSETQNVLGTLKSILGISALLILVFVGIGGAFLAGRTLKPVDQITGTAQEISESDLSRRIDVKTEDELGRLATTLNKMIARLEVAFKRQRDFTADASHEMRTPLAVIQAESTLTLAKERTIEEYRKSLELISQEVVYMSELLGKLLFLARSDAGKEPLKFEDVSLGDLVSQLGMDMEVLAREKGLNFTLGTVENITLKGDKLKLRQMILNIMANAIRYTPNGGSIFTTLVKQKDQAIVSVTDTGIGIAPEHLPLLFERFYRVDKARSRSEGGSGLGLAIAKNIAEVHQGKIEVESEVGKGSTFRLILPIVNHGLDLPNS
jgi:heavy metal sensor kinase